MIRITKELGDSATRSNDFDSREAYRNDLAGSWQLDHDVVRAWAETVSRYCPGFHVNVDEPDTPERTARRGRAAQMQRMYNEIFEERAFGQAFQALRRESSVPRPLWTLMSHAPGSDGHNRQIADILQHGTKEQITELVQAQVQRAHEFIREAESYTDQQLAENGHRVYHNAKIVMDIPNMMDLVNNGTLNESLRPLLEEVHNATEEMGQQLQARMQAMASPLYPYATPEELMNMDAGSMFMQVESGDNALAPAVQGDEAASDYAARIQELQMGAMRRRGRYLQEQVKNWYQNDVEHPEDIPWINPNDGTTLSKDLKDIRPNQPVGVPDPKDGKVYFYYLKEGPNHQITAREVTLEQYLNRQIVSRLPDLAENLEIADHAATFGSSQFRAMKNAMKALQENFQPLGNTPTWNQRRELFHQLDDLRDAANAYLQHKGDGPYKHDAERSRVWIGRQLKEFAQQQLDALELENRPQQLAREAQKASEAQAAKMQAAGTQAKIADDTYDNLHRMLKLKTPVRAHGKMVKAIYAVREGRATQDVLDKREAKKAKETAKNRDARIPETPEEQKARLAREARVKERRDIRAKLAAAGQQGKVMNAANEALGLAEKVKAAQESQEPQEQNTEAEGRKRKIRTYKRTSPTLKALGNELHDISENQPIGQQPDEQRFSADVTKIWKAKHLQALKLGKTIDPDSHLGQIYESALDKLGDNRTAELMSVRTFTPENEAYARELMGELAVVDLILHERAASNGGPGLLEQSLNGMEPKNFMKGMTGSKDFRDMTQNLTPKTFSEFLRKNGERSFTKKVSEQFRQNETYENTRRAQKQQAPMVK